MANQMTLSRRERQIMDVMYRVGEATASDIQMELPDPPSYSAVRAMLRLLEEKGWLRHERDGMRYVYKPAINPDTARRSALRHLVHTFFGGSTAEAASALLGMPESKLSDEEKHRLQRLIDEARKEGR